MSIRSPSSGDRRGRSQHRIDASDEYVVERTGTTASHPNPRRRSKRAIIRVWFCSHPAPPARARRRCTISCRCWRSTKSRALAAHDHVPVCSITSAASTRCSTTCRTAMCDHGRGSQARDRLQGDTGSSGGVAADVSDLPQPASWSARPTRRTTVQPQDGHLRHRSDAGEHAGAFPRAVSGCPNAADLWACLKSGILRSKSKSSDSLWVKVGGEGFETRVVDGLLEIKAKSAMLGYSECAQSVYRRRLVHDR